MHSPLDEVRNALGAPKRKLGWFTKAPIEFPPPAWAAQDKDDQVLVVFQHLRQIYQEGLVVWGAVVLAERDMYHPGDVDRSGYVLYSLRDPDEVALSLLPQIFQRLRELPETEPDPSWTQDERELAEDIRSGTAYLGGYRLPDHWVSPERDYRLTTMLFHRGHLPSGYIPSRLLPLLVMPWSPFPAIVVPEKYWTPTVRAIVTGAGGDPVQHGDSRASRENLYKETLGPITFVYHEMQTRAQHIDVYLFGPREPSDSYLYITGGMSDASMPDALGAGSRAELALYSSHRSEHVVELLRNFAHYPFETGQALGHGHTVPLLHHAERVLGTPRFPYLLFLAALNVRDKDLGHNFTIDGEPVHPLMVVPITMDELEFIKAQGADAFCQRVSASPVSIRFDPARPSILAPPPTTPSPAQPPPLPSQPPPLPSSRPLSP